MEERSGLNRRLREDIHRELDLTRELLSRVRHWEFRKEGKKMYDSLFKWVEDRSKRVRSSKLQKVFIGVIILKERINDKLDLENRRANVIHSSQNIQNEAPTINSLIVEIDRGSQQSHSSVNIQNESSTINSLSPEIDRQRPHSHFSANILNEGPTIHSLASEIDRGRQHFRSSAIVQNEGPINHSLTPEIDRASQHSYSSASNPHEVPNINSLVPEVERERQLSNSLANIQNEGPIINSLTPEADRGRQYQVSANERFSTVASTTYDTEKPHAANNVDKEIYEMAGCYDSMPNSSHNSSKQVGVDSTERLAMKYPRKKVTPLEDSDLFKVPNAPPKRPSSPLFRRRHEIFNSSKTIAATYGEYKRQTLAKKVWESRPMASENSTVRNQPLHMDPRLVYYKKVGKCVPSIALPTGIELQSNNQNMAVAQEKHDKEKKDNGVNGKEKELVEIDGKTAEKTMVETIQQRVETSSPKRDNTLPPAETTSQCTETSTIELDNTLPKTKTAEQAKKDEKSENSVAEVTLETTNIAVTNRPLDDHNPVVSNSSNSGKLVNTKKSNKSTRELNDLLSYTSEFMANYKRKEKSSVNHNLQTSDKDLLQQFGISKQLKVVLAKVATDKNTISPQPEAKILNASKKPFAENQMKRRNSICFDPRKIAKSTEHTESKDARSKQTIENAKKPTKVPKAKKSTCQKPEKKDESVYQDCGSVTTGVTSMKQNPSPKLKEDGKTGNKRKLQKKSTQGSSPKKQCLDKAAQGDKSLPGVAITGHDSTGGGNSLRTLPLVEPLLANVRKDVDFVYNNKSQVHCHSEYMTQCCLCDFKDIRQTEIVSHYVYNHPACEVIVSRITPEQAKLVKQNPFAIEGKLVVSRHGNQTISFRCHFCEMRCTLKEIDWVHHLVNHTGEYRYRCRACPAMARTADEHVKHEEICGDPEMIVCNDVVFEENQLYGYICELCNFIQIRRFNMEKHLRREHQFQEASCLRFSLVNYEIDQECVLGDSIITAVKQESVKMEASNVNLPSVAKEEEEETRLNPVNDEMQMIQEELQESIEKPELILPDYIEEYEQPHGVAIMLNDQDDSNDSTSTIPMVAIDEQILQGLITAEDDLLKTHTCNQEVMLTNEKINQENIVNEEFGVATPVQYVNGTGDSEQYSVSVMRQLENNAENMCNSNLDDNRWRVITTFTNKNKIVLKKTDVQMQQNVSESVCPVLVNDFVNQLSDRWEATENHAVSTSEVPCPVMESTLNHPVIPLIRPRKLPGDSLSFRAENAEMPKNTQAKSQVYDPRPATSSNVAQNIQMFGAQPTTVTACGNPKIVYPIQTIVKPWIERHSTVCSRHHWKTVTYECLGSFFKCMGDGCSFHTDDREVMRQHLKGHMIRDIRSPALNEKPWLECCYCQDTASSIDSLLHHLCSVHKYCAFQCNRCYYRSREASSAFIHQLTYHVENESFNVIYECSKEYKRYSTADQDAIILMMNNTVEQLKCTVCRSVKYFDLLEYKTHLLTHKEQFISCHVCHQLIQTNSMLKHMKLHKVFLYQCVYCVYGTDQKNVIKHHVSRDHPEKICCFHIRESKRTNGANVSLGAIPSPIRPFVRVEENISSDRIRLYR